MFAAGYRILLASGLLCLALGLIACGDSYTTLEPPDYGEDPLAGSSSSLRYDIQTTADSLSEEIVDSAAVVAEVGACTAERKGNIARTTHCGSTCYVICDSSGWRFASTDDRDKEGFPEDTVAGAVLSGRLVSLSNSYVFEDGDWRLMTFVEKSIGYCDSSVYGKIDSVRGTYYYCYEVKEDDAWWARISPLLADMLLAPDDSSKGDVLVGPRSDRYMIYEDSVWRPATIYEVIGACSDERDGELVQYGETLFQCRQHNWMLADRKGAIGDCTPEKIGTERKIDSLKFVCGADGWEPVGLHSHKVDSSFFWNSLVDVDACVDVGTGTSTSGFLFEYTDEIYDGLTELEYPMYMKAVNNVVQLGSLVQKFGGLEAYAEFSYGFYRPFAGFGFNIWNEREWSPVAEGADIRPWKGLCVAYESDSPVVLAVVPEGGDALVGGNYHKVRLAAGYGHIVVDVPFENFAQDPGWGDAADLDVVLASAATVLLYIEGEPVTEGWFRIEAVGSLGSCDSLLGNPKK